MGGEQQAGGSVGASGEFGTGGLQGCAAKTSETRRRGSGQSQQDCAPRCALSSQSLVQTPGTSLFIAVFVEDAVGRPT